ncbi:origin recognition complex subunit 4-like [Corylus avellana]|uniref:origin recognition complex subunit 4-like n=1 Tax=Corylus avellana TaxID=13451 RepID=UPI001E1ECB91|nr:origin recognition complex subunit 4-like [Corylus avellana]XP_059463360.1 origin recognition complex subunit 4-like [Corylus avellana]
MMESVSSKNQYEQLQQLKRKGRRRTSKLKPDWHMAIAESLPSDDQRHHEQLLPKHRGWGRPPKSKEDIDPPIAHQNLNGHQKEGCESQGRHPTPKRKADTILQESIPLDHQNHNELQLQQPGKRGQGRPPRPKPVLATTMEALLPSQQQEQPQRRGQGRPPKRKLFTDRMMGEPLTSESQLQQPKCQGRGRPPKVDQQ